MNQKVAEVLKNVESKDHAKISLEDKLVT